MCSASVKWWVCARSTAREKSADISVCGGKGGEREVLLLEKKERSGQSEEISFSACVQRVSAWCLSEDCWLRAKSAMPCRRSAC